jgi:hypothetical protein
MGSYSIEGTYGVKALKDLKEELRNRNDEPPEDVNVNSFLRQVSGAAFLFGAGCVSMCMYACINIYAHTYRNM